MAITYILQGKFEDAKGVFGSRKQKDIQYNGQTKKNNITSIACVLPIIINQVCNQINSTGATSGEGTA